MYEDEIVEVPSAEQLIIDDESIGDLSGVPESDVLPAFRDTKVKIVKLNPMAKDKEGNLKERRWFKADIVLEDGILVGEDLKYKNKHYFSGPLDIVYKIQAGKNQRQLAICKQLCRALGIDLKDVKSPMQVKEAAEGQYVLMSLRQAKETAFDESTSTYVETGDLVNRITGFKPVPIDQLV